MPKLYLSFSFQLPSHAPSPPISQGNRVFFLTVYLKNWEYSQNLLSEETLPNNSCESPLLPPSFSSSPFSLPHFCIFLFWCLVALWYKARGCPRAAEHKRHSIWWTVLRWKAIPWILVIALICVSVCYTILHICAPLLFFPPFSYRKKTVLIEELRDNMKSKQEILWVFSAVSQLHSVLLAKWRKYYLKMWFAVSPS